MYPDFLGWKMVNVGVYIYISYMDGREPSALPASKCGQAPQFAKLHIQCYMRQLAWTHSPQHNLNGDSSLPMSNKDNKLRDVFDWNWCHVMIQKRWFGISPLYINIYIYGEISSVFKNSGNRRETTEHLPPPTYGHFVPFPHLCWISPHTPWKTNMTGWKTQPFEDVSPIEKGDVPLSC